MAPLRGDETALYDRHAASVRRDVAAYTHADDALVDDACAHAWAKLVARQPRRETVAGWLWRVAVHEVWRLQRIEREQQGLADGAPSRTTRSRRGTSGSKP